MTKIHDKFVIELAEVIKGYGNPPDVEEPFRVSEFYRFYELPNVAVSRENFEKMTPINQWIPCSERLPECRGIYIISIEGYVFPAIYHPSGVYDGTTIYDGYFWTDLESGFLQNCPDAWMPLPEGYRGEQDESWQK